MNQQEVLLQQRLRSDLKQALRSGDRVRVSIIRLVIAGISNAEIAQGAPLDDSAVLGIIAKEAKRHRESIDAFTKGNRQDLVSKEEAELGILLEYLPKPMSTEEIAATARQVIAEVGAKGPTDKGKVMSKLMPQLKGKAEGQEVNSIVSELLASLSG
jgi:uncharacterized protein YqeY